MTDYDINGERLWASLMAMAEIGSIPNCGCRRLALSDEDSEARSLFRLWCRQEGLLIRMDNVGNIFARREGAKPELRSICFGSHLDTQPNGGRFDGVLGVLAGLEVVRTLNEHDIRTEHAIEIAVWTNEEGCRFAPAMLGSSVFSGLTRLPDALAATDIRGITFGGELIRTEEHGTYEVNPSEFAAYLELHIEQGPILEDLGKSIGIVTGAQGIRWYDVTIVGVASHAGPFPMERREDALLTAALLVQEINRLAHAFKDARGTVGEFSVEPSSRNVVPGRVMLSIDLRHHTEKVLAEMHVSLLSIIAAFRKRFSNQDIELTEVWHSSPVPFDDQLTKVIRCAAAKCNADQMDIISGAGHDAVNLARVVPTAMIFIPCRSGISHNEAEFAEAQHVAEGTNVLLHSVLEIAGIAIANDMHMPKDRDWHPSRNVSFNLHPK